MPTKKHQDWKVYIIETLQGALYTGITTDVERRFQEHLEGKKKGARFFHTSKPGRVVYTETQPDRAAASRRESEIKKLSRQDKLLLIQGN